MIRKKKAQEEMVGFVLIIVIVAVIAIIVLAIGIKKPVKMQESKEIGNFLYSSLLVTTECQPSDERYYDFSELIKACYKNERCSPDINSEEACQVLNRTAIRLIESSFQLAEGARFKGYGFKITAENDTIIQINKGNETKAVSGSKAYIPSADKRIDLTLEIYY